LRLKTTGTTGKNNERALKESCFKQLFPIIKKPDGELRRCAHHLLMVNENLKIPEFCVNTTYKNAEFCV